MRLSVIAMLQSSMLFIRCHQAHCSGDGALVFSIYIYTPRKRPLVFLMMRAVLLTLTFATRNIPCGRATSIVDSDSTSLYNHYGV
jgi:hypothetical protein